MVKENEESSESGGLEEVDHFLVNGLEKCESSNQNGHLKILIDPDFLIFEFAK